MADLLSLAPEELADKLKAMGQSAFRARQLYSWLVRGVDYDGMTNLPRALREALAAEGPANPVRILRSVVSQKDGTEKYLYELCDGNIVEGVTMRYNYGDTLCVSTQVGCRMGCRFCASTLEGCVRDLTPGELLGQIIAVNAHLRNRDGAAEHIGNVVLMGSGEPLDNYDNVVKFLRLMNREGRVAHVAARCVFVHLWAGAAYIRSGGRGIAGYAVHLAACAQRRYTQTAHADSQPLCHGRHTGRMPQLHRAHWQARYI